MHYKVQIATSRITGSLCYMDAMNLIHNYPEIELVNESPDIFISVLYDKIIPEDFIKSVPGGCYNFHPGILPDYRGAGYYSWAIINNENTAGITLHRIDKSIDTGRIIDIRKFPICKYDTGQSLHERGCDEMRKIFNKWFIRLVLENLEIEDRENNGGHLYTRKDIEKARDITEIPIQEWNKYIRAFQFDDKEGCYIKHKDSKFLLKI